jgi:hypothetical protein
MEKLMETSKLVWVDMSEDGKARLVDEKGNEIKGLIGGK